MSRMSIRNRKLVLVVDDDPGMLKAVQRLLRQHAYEPILFSSAQAFKSHSDIEKAACVILDINLPDGSGIELREDLKAAGVSVPVIYITGNANPKVREAAIASGCVAFLTKPFSAHELIEPLKKASAGALARFQAHCTLYFGTMHRRTAFPDLISEFGLSGTVPIQVHSPPWPRFPKDWGHTFTSSALGLAVSCISLI